MRIELSSIQDLPALSSAWRAAGPEETLILALTASLEGGSLLLDDPFGKSGPIVRLEGGGHGWRGGALTVRGAEVHLADVLFEDTAVNLTVAKAARLDRVGLLWSRRAEQGGGSHAEGLALLVQSTAPGATATVHASVLATTRPEAALRVATRGRAGAPAPALVLDGSVLAGAVEGRQAPSDPPIEVRGGRVIGPAAGLALGADTLRGDWTLGQPTPWAEAARSRDLASPAWAR